VRIDSAVITLGDVGTKGGGAEKGISLGSSSLSRPPPLLSPSAAATPHSPSMKEAVDVLIVSLVPFRGRRAGSSSRSASRRRGSGPSVALAQLRRIDG